MAERIVYYMGKPLTPELKKVLDETKEFFAKMDIRNNRTGRKGMCKSCPKHSIIIGTKNLFCDKYGKACQLVARNCRDYS